MGSIDLKMYKNVTKDTQYQPNTLCTTITYKGSNFCKYLGVTIDKNLSWSEHIKQIRKKANNVKSFLQRNVSKCPVQIKSNCYKALVKPMLEYASIVWSPQTLMPSRMSNVVQQGLLLTITPGMLVYLRCYLTHTKQRQKRTESYYVV